MTISYLAYFPSPPRGVWYLGPVPIRAYALFIIVGIVVALLIGDRRWAARGGERGVIYDIALWAVPFGLLGGRLYHLLTDWRTYFGSGGAGLNAALRIWDGGLGIWGAVALGGVGAWIGCRRRGISLPAFGDAVAPGIVLAQAIGRLGNYFNQELFGRETTMPWGLEIYYRRDPSGFVDVHSLDGVSTGQLALVVQPTFLYEMLWNLVVFGALLYLDKRFVLDRGRLFATYVAAYCVGRFTIELLRDDAATHIAGIRINSFTSTFVFIGSVVYIILVSRIREDTDKFSGPGETAAQRISQRADQLTAVTSGVGGAGPAVAAGSVLPPPDQPALQPPTLQPEAEAVVAEAEAIEGDVPEAEVLPLELEPSDGEVLETASEVAAVPVEAGETPDEEPQGDEPEAEALAEVEAAEPEIDELEVAEPEIDEPEAEAEAIEGDVPEAEVLPVDLEPAFGEVLETASEAAAVPVEADETPDEEPQGDEPDPEAVGEVEPDEPEIDELEVAEPEIDEPEIDEPEIDEPVAEAEAIEGDVPEAEVLPLELEPSDGDVLETASEAAAVPVEADETPDEEPQGDEPEAEALAEVEPEEPEIDEPEAAEPASADPEVATAPSVVDESANEETAEAEQSGEADSEDDSAEVEQAVTEVAPKAQLLETPVERTRWWRRRR